MNDIQVVPNMNVNVGRVNELDRYDRQVRVWGSEGQKRIEALKVAVIGSGNLAGYTALPLAALGVGEIRLLGSDEVIYAAKFEGLLDVKFEKGSIVDNWARILRRINPNVNILPLSVSLESRVACAFLEGADVVVDATNDPRSKYLAFTESKGAFISASVKFPKAKAMRAGSSVSGVEIFMPNFNGVKFQDYVISLLWGGVIAEEVKKVALKQPLFDRDLHYRMSDVDRFTFGDFQGPAFQDLVNYSVLVVGCGALGNMMTIALAHLGVGKVTFVDCDKFDSTNLNRQVLAYDGVGLHKAEVLAEKLKRMNPRAESRGIDLLFEIKDGEFSIDRFGGKYDCVLSLVDNFYARAVIQAWAVKRGVSLINAASSYDGCEVSCFVPGKTSCLDHVHAGYYDRARKEEIVRRQSCAAEPDPSVIMTNQISAGLAALELVRVASPSLVPFNGVLKYSANADVRLGENKTKDVCECYKHPELVPDLEIK